MEGGVLEKVTGKGPHLLRLSLQGSGLQMLLPPLLLRQPNSVSVPEMGSARTPASPSLSMHLGRLQAYKAGWTVPRQSPQASRSCLLASVRQALSLLSTDWPSGVGRDPAKYLAPPTLPPGPLTAAVPTAWAQWSILTLL